MHKETIQFVDGDTGEVRVMLAEQVPETIRYQTTDSGRVRVMRVVVFHHADRRTILSYDAEGTLLRSETMI